MLRRRSSAVDDLGAGPRPASDDEACLIARVAARDLRAFEALYRLYHPRLTRFLSNMIARRQLTEEVLNDTMMVVWDRPQTYNGTSKVSTWIFAIAYRKALKSLKRYDEPVEDQLLEARPSPDGGPELALERRQAREALMGAMGELSPDHRAVVDLSYFHDMGYREIAEIMDCPVDTVKTRMFHARRHLRAKLVGPAADWL